MATCYSEFEGKHILVTGAGAGIGRAVAEAFAAEGAVVSALDVNETGLSELAASFPNTHPVICDLIDLEKLEEITASAQDKRGAITVLINNAGVDRRMALEQQTPDDFRWMLSVNLEHQAHLSKLVAPGMAKLGGGSIVNLSSTAWMKMAGNLTAYHAAKSGIIGLTKGLARDLGPQLIRVNAIAPGRVFTTRAASQVDETWKTETKQLQCLPELIAPQDIAEAALWLGSKRSRMVTGQTIIIDGGVV